MIHWGDTGSALGRTIDIRGDDLPSIQPRESRLVYTSGATINQNQPRSRRARAFRGPPVLLHSMSNDGLWGTMPTNTSPTTPLNAPTLGPDAFAFLSDWRNRFGNRMDGEREVTRRQFFDNLNNPRYEHQPLPSVDEADGGDSSHHRFPQLDRSSTDDPVEIREIDLKHRQNAVSHHTSDFECIRNPSEPHLVLRRGQPFEIEVTLSRPYNPDRENIEVVMEIGEYPRESHGTRMTLPLRKYAPHDSSLEGLNWWAEIKNIRSSYATMCIHIGSNAIVGSWTMKLVTTLKPETPPTDLITSARESLKMLEYVYPVHNVYILFNPWCPDDQVYMAKEEDLQEFVMNDVGKIWRGSYNALKPTSWVYGQFEQVVLDACMMIMDKSHLPLPVRSSPIQVARTISAIVNSPDEEGIMEGNWTGEYRGGVPPTDWTGSIDILRRYAATGRPVQFGQCWTFSGVVCTICRCLGIPCRVVTNYSSAHDTNTSVTVDYHVDTEGRPLKHLNTDSVWNFHVWNDVWMDRPDLPKGYSGWQTIDGTPQEKSDGLYRCGPAPLLAVKNGEIGLGFDTAFVFAEVNADKCYWLHAGRGLQFVDKETDRIGRMTCTKWPGQKLAPFNKDLMDITDEYKFPEGTKAERMAVMTALFTGGSHAIMAYRQDISRPSDVECKLDLREEIVIGNDIHITLRLKNMSDSPRTVNVSLRADTIMYMGTNPRKVKAERMVVMLHPGAEAIGQMTVTVREYLHRLMDQSAFLATVMAHVKETGQLYTASDDFRVKKPDVSIRLEGKPRVGKSLKVHLELANPIPVQLTNCKFILDGPGITHPTEVAIRSVMPHGVAKVTTELHPWKEGEHALIVHFTSNQLTDVDGYITAYVSQ